MEELSEVTAQSDSLRIFDRPLEGCRSSQLSIYRFYQPKVDKSIFPIRAR